MNDGVSDPLTDLFALVGLPNPVAGVGRSLDQFRRGVDEMLTTMARFNDTLDQLNGVARRVNGLLDEVEEPLKAAMPQITRTVRTADLITQQLTVPIERLTPGLGRLAEVLSAPTISRLPGDLASVVESLGDLVRRLQPLTQAAETAGSMLGLRALGGLFPRGSDRTEASASTPPAPETTPPTASTTTTTPAKKPPAKKTAARRAPAAKAAAKRAPAKAATTPKSAPKGAGPAA